MPIKLWKWSKRPSASHFWKGWWLATTMVKGRRIRPNGDLTRIDGQEGFAESLVNYLIQAAAQWSNDRFGHLLPSIGQNGQIWPIREVSYSTRTTAGLTRSRQKLWELDWEDIMPDSPEPVCITNVSSKSKSHDFPLEFEDQCGWGTSDALEHFRRGCSLWKIVSRMVSMLYKFWFRRLRPTYGGGRVEVFHQWVQLGVRCYELLKPSETINAIQICNFKYDPKYVK